VLKYEAAFCGYTVLPLVYITAYFVSCSVIARRAVVHNFNNLERKKPE
jgi:hypothetical protein